MYKVHAPLAPKVGVIVRPPRNRNHKNSIRPFKNIVRVTLPKSARIQKPSLLPELMHTNGAPYFHGPITPHEVVEKYSFLLNDSEVLELSDYSEVYYIRLNPPHMKASSRTIPNFFKFVADDHIAFRFQQQELLGKGSFGSVIKCLDHKTGNTVAIKLMRDKKKVHEEILFENKIITKLQDGDGSNNSNIIRYIENFKFRGFYCIVMELLWKDTYTVLQSRHFVGFGPSTIKMIAYETAKALSFMHKHNVVHCDIKPENIMFTSDKREGVKIIDFGCSCNAGQIIFAYIQSRFYRAPEVILGIDYNKEIDIWSLGCVLCELVTGRPLFDAGSQLELLQLITELLGECPSDMIEEGSSSHKFYMALEDKQGNVSYHLKINPGEKRKVIPGSTTIIKETNVTNSGFINLITSCLKWRPEERVTADELLNDPWLTGH